MTVDGEIFSSRSSAEISMEDLNSALGTVSIVQTQVTYRVKVVLPDGSVEYFNAETLGEAFSQAPILTEQESEIEESFNTVTTEMGSLCLWLLDAAGMLCLFCSRMEP